MKHGEKEKENAFGSDLCDLHDPDAHTHKVRDIA